MSETIVSQLCQPLQQQPHRLPLYAVALLIPLLGATLSFLCSDCSPEAVRWRNSLVKSRISPPSSVTAVIWITLYVLMGHASYVVYMALLDQQLLLQQQQHEEQQQAVVKVEMQQVVEDQQQEQERVQEGERRSMVMEPSLVAYLVQCLLNHFFIVVLFGLQRIDLALLMIVPLWVATGVTMVLFYEVVPLAGALMAVVFAWVSLNVYLNAVLLVNNPVYTELELPPEPLRRQACKREVGDKVS